MLRQSGPRRALVLISILIGYLSQPFHLVRSGNEAARDVKLKAFRDGRVCLNEWKWGLLYV